MFIKKRAGSPAGTVIGAGIRIEAAKLTGHESVRIDGEYIGDLDLDGSVIVGETGKLSGELRAQSIKVAGTVIGRIHCAMTMHMTPTAHVDGSIETGALITDEGACFSGSCQMKGEAQEEAFSFAEGPENEFNKKFDRFVDSLGSSGR